MTNRTHLIRLYINKHLLSNILINIVMYSVYKSKNNSTLNTFTDLHKHFVSVSAANIYTFKGAVCDVGEEILINFKQFNNLH